MLSKNEPNIESMIIYKEKCIRLEKQRIINSYSILSKLKQEIDILNRKSTLTPYIQ